MSNTPEFEFDWDGVAMLPVAKDRQRCEEEFVAGRQYKLTQVEPRSQQSHRHQFAEIAHAFEMLNENLKEQFPTAERLRKYALIRTGYCTHIATVYDTRKDALAAGRMVQPLADKKDETFWLVTVVGTVVHQFIPLSQSYKAMGKKQFQESKEACLRWIANELLHVSVDDLKHYSRNAA